MHEIDVSLKKADIDVIKLVVHSTAELVLLVTQANRISQAKIELPENSPVSADHGIRKFYSGGMKYLTLLNEHCRGRGGFIYASNVEVAYIVLSHLLSKRLTDQDLNEENIQLTMCVYFGLHERATDKKIMRSPTAFTIYMGGSDLKLLSNVSGVPYSSFNKWFFSRYSMFTSIMRQVLDQRLGERREVMNNDVFGKVMPIAEKLQS